MGDSEISSGATTIRQNGETDGDSLQPTERKWYSRFLFRSSHDRHPAPRYPILDETPSENGAGQPSGSIEMPPYKYTNFLRQVTTREEEWVNYLSTTRFKPRKMAVQTASRRLESDAYPRDWISRPVKGHVPFVIQLSRWATKPLLSGNGLNGLQTFLRSLIVAVPILIMLLYPLSFLWHTSAPKDTYQEFVGYHWNWPNYTINELDMKPGSAARSRQARRRLLDTRSRLEYPKRLLIKGPDGTWRLTDTEQLAVWPKYLFISHIGSRSKDEEPHYRNAAQSLAESERFNAVYLDESCFERGIRRRVKQGELSEVEGQQMTDYDIYTLCDVVRGSSKVAFIYPTSSTPINFQEEWGKRMWTFLEGLLAPGNSIIFCPWDYDEASSQSGHAIETFQKVELASRCWGIAQGQTDKEGGNSTRILAEHFSGLLSLTSLELLPLAMHAFSSRNNGQQNSLSDMAYATMGLLRYRIERDREDVSDPTLFQTLAHLSLKNDSDKIIDRIISLLPNQRHANDIPQHVSDGMIWTSLCEKDSFGTLVHHVTSLCEVVGVAKEDQTIFLDNCHAINIRWKDFPPASYRSGQGGARRKLIWVLVLVAFLLIALIAPLAVVYAMNEAGNQRNYSRYGSAGGDSSAGLLAALICVSVSGLLIAASIPRVVYSFFALSFVRCGPNLIGFEGVMTIRQLEELIFGISLKRLRYAPSASHLFTDERDLDENDRLYREGKPEWIENNGDPERIQNLLKKGQRVFTLVDMATLSVIVFAADRPPSVALLPGREGGMLRAVLCSWSFRNDCLYKEAVVRMPSSVMANAKPTNWLKLCLQPLNEARKAQRRVPLSMQRYAKVEELVKWAGKEEQTQGDIACQTKARDALLQARKALHIAECATDDALAQHAQRMMEKAVRDAEAASAIAAVGMASGA